jgi:hypothetical protein
MKALPLGFALALSSCAVQEGPPYDPSEVPDARRFLNAQILDTLDRYPTDGTYRYFWPGDGSSHGTTREIFFAGERIAVPNPNGTHCCGMVFETYMRSCEELAKSPLAGLGVADVRELEARFFGNSRLLDEHERNVQVALVSMQLGNPILRLEQARPGDLVQFWRHIAQGSSGHQAVFLGWDRARDGRIVGIRYWSSQRVTNGIGVNTESIGESYDQDGVNRDKIFLVRALATPRSGTPSASVEPRTSWLWPELFPVEVDDAITRSPRWGAPDLGSAAP